MICCAYADLSPKNGANGNAGASKNEFRIAVLPLSSIAGYRNPRLAIASQWVT